jgi:phospholipase C
VVSPFARRNYVDHTVTDQTSVLRFIEDNFNLGRLDVPGKSVAQGGSFDQVAGSLDSLFDFDQEEDEDGGHGRHDDRDARRLILDANTGQPARW